MPRFTTNIYLRIGVVGSSVCLQCGILTVLSLLASLIYNQHHSYADECSRLHGCSWQLGYLASVSMVFSLCGCVRVWIVHACIIFLWLNNRSIWIIIAFFSSHNHSYGHVLVFTSHGCYLISQ